jgi:(p)ppGpp synthase/HD superfamily hydrolase
VVYAQTNLQLFNQMREAGYSDTDLVAVRSAYDLAIQLFTGEFRASGKPLLAHSVGTASVLCALAARVDLIAAAILHAAYMFGEFGDGRRGADPRKRRVLEGVVGTAIEDLVMRYHALVWNAETIPALADTIDSMAADETDVLLIRLANELEDHVDLGVLYCGNAERRRRDIRMSLHRCVAMARQLGHPGLAEELQRAFDEVLSTDVPDALRNCREYTYFVPPSSHSLRIPVIIRRLLDRYPHVGRMLHPRKLVRGWMAVRPVRSH